jgi:hypothetical protein
LFDRNASQIGKISGVSLTYTTGEEIRKGDRVLFHDEPGEIELVADPVVSDPETAWYVQEYGGGVMILEPKYFWPSVLLQPADGLRSRIRCPAKLKPSNCFAFLDVLSAFAHPFHLLSWLAHPNFSFFR